MYIFTFFLYFGLGLKVYLACTSKLGPRLGRSKVHSSPLSTILPTDRNLSTVFHSENFFENGITLMSITRWFLTLEPWIANLVRHNTSLVSLFCYLKMFHFEKAHLVYKDEKKYYVVKIIAPLRLEKICLPLSQKKTCVQRTEIMQKVWKLLSNYIHFCLVFWKKYGAMKKKTSNRWFN